MTILEKRSSYKPFEYPTAYSYWEKHELSYWLWNEVPMDSDVKDWNYNLSGKEKSVIGGILKGFAQTECLVQNYWLQAALWFPKAEIASMCTTFAEAETRHAKAYNFLNEKLGLEEYDAFLQEPEVASRINNLITVSDPTPQNIALSLAVFSALCEGVCLFSAFAVLQHFKRNNKLKGTGKLIEWSQKEEALHSEAGCWLYRTLIEEYPEVNTKELHDKVYEAATHTLDLEYSYIDYVFKEGNIEGLQKEDLKAYITGRTNTKLGDLGLEAIFPYDKEKAKRVEDWFGALTISVVQTDFFANAEANYSKQTLNVDELEW